MPGCGALCRHRRRHRQNAVRIRLLGGPVSPGLHQRRPGAGSAANGRPEGASVPVPLRSGHRGTAGRSPLSRQDCGGPADLRCDRPAGRRPLSGGLSGLCQRRRRPGLLGGLRGARCGNTLRMYRGRHRKSSESPVLSFLPHCSGDFSRGHHPGDPGGPSIIISAPVHDLILPDHKCFEVLLGAGHILVLSIRDVQVERQRLRKNIQRPEPAAL